MAHRHPREAGIQFLKIMLNSECMGELDPRFARMTVWCAVYTSTGVVG